MKLLSKLPSIYLSLYQLIAPLQGNCLEALPGSAKEESLEEFMKRTGSVLSIKLFLDSPLIYMWYGCCFLVIFNITSSVPCHSLNPCRLSCNTVCSLIRHLFRFIYTFSLASSSNCHIVSHLFCFHKASMLLPFKSFAVVPVS